MESLFRYKGQPKCVPTAALTQKENRGRTSQLASNRKALSLLKGQTALFVRADLEILDTCKLHCFEDMVDVLQLPFETPDGGVAPIKTQSSTKFNSLSDVEFWLLDIKLLYVARASQERSAFLGVSI